MSKRIATLETDNIEIKTEDVVGRGDSGRSWLLINDNFYDIKKYEATENPPLIPFEPDFNFLTAHYKFNSHGNFLYDYSGFNNHLEFLGEACPTTGINQGLRGSAQFHSTAMQFDNLNEIISARPVHWEQNDNPANMTITGATGMSYVFFLNIGQQANAQDWATFYEYSDDASNKVRIVYDGNLKLLIKRAGVDTKIRTDVGDALQPNTDYILVLTFNNTGPAVKIYINGTDTSTTTSSDTWSTGQRDDEHFFFIDANDTTGLWNYNFVQEFRMYRNKVLTQTEVNNLQTNKLTITNIPFGRVAISDACVVPIHIGDPSFTSTSFTSTSFTQ